VLKVKMFVRMFCFCLFSILAGTVLLGVQLSAQEVENPFSWAYPPIRSADAPPPEPDDGQVHRIPGSDQEYRMADINFTNAADWHPDNHPPMPPIVANGRPPVGACAFCHFSNGLGKPENANLAGLPADYIVQQFRDYKAGSRTTSDPGLITPAAMLAIAVNATDEEIEIAANYFSSLTPAKWINVVESDMVPETYISAWLFVEKEEGDTEPLGQRILEMPMDFERTELRDDSSQFIAYVPVGSLARGEVLVNTGAGITQQCALCHGENLKGLGPIPGIAGRSPSYLTRQLYDFQTGARSGLWSPLMQPVVEKLSASEIIDIIAYVSSLEP